METARQEKDRKNRALIRDLIADMPPYYEKYINHGLATGSKTLTLLNYTYDMRIFLGWATGHKEGYRNLPMRDVPLQLFIDITQHDLDDYQLYLRSYPDPSGKMTPMKDRNGKIVCWKKGEAGPEGEPRMVPVIRKNDDAGVRRKSMSLSTFYNYLILNDLAPKNPLFKRKVVSVTEKPEKIRLKNDEPGRLLQGIEDGAGVYTVRQKRFHEMLFRRDYAMIVVFLDTGIRVSELVGLDMTDLNFQESYFLVTRKGGRQDKVFFSDEVSRALLDYIEGEPIPENLITRYSEKQLNGYMDFIRQHLLSDSLEDVIRETYGDVDDTFLSDMETIASYLRASGRSAFRPDNTNAVFLSLRGKRISISSVQKMLKKYILNCLIIPMDGHQAVDPGTIERLHKVSVHKLRTSYATRLAEAGVTPEVMRKLMGHSSPSVVFKYYTDVENSRLRDVASTIQTFEDD